MSRVSKRLRFATCNEQELVNDETGSNTIAIEEAIDTSTENIDGNAENPAGVDLHDDTNNKPTASKQNNNNSVEESTAESKQQIIVPSAIIHHNKTNLTSSRNEHLLDDMEDSMDKLMEGFQG